MQSIPDGFELVHCPGCASLQYTVAYTGRDWILNTDTPMQIALCQGCGLHYVNPRPDPDHIARYYPQDYAPHRRQRGEIDRDSRLSTGLRLLILRNAYAAPHLRPRGWKRVLAVTAGLLKPPHRCGQAVAYHGRGRLLDFGCGNGTFLRRMAALGWDVTGIDFSPTAVQAVRDSGLKAHQGSLPHPELPPASFDLITMRQALEHVPQPREVLQSAHNLLDHGGLLHVQVPNYASWDNRHLSDASHLLQLPIHLLHFTPTTLAGLLDRCGFTEVSVRQAGRPAWLRKSVAMMRDRGMSKPSGLLATGLGCKWIAWHAARKGFGNELIATARKAP